MQNLTREAKLYPSKRQEQVLVQLFGDCRILYNDILETKIETYQKGGKNLSRYDLYKMFKTYEANIPASLKQCIASRVVTAFDRFFGEQNGFPRFKSKNRFRSIGLRQYQTDYRIIGNVLSVWKSYGLGYIKTRGLQPLENPKGARIVKRASGWYLQVIDEVEEKQTKKNNKEVGVDLGLRYFVADSNGGTIKAPQLFKKTQRKLRVQQRGLKNKTKFSNRWKKQTRQIARTYEHITNQRKDFLHKVARKYADNNDVVYAEDLNVSGMVRNHHLAKSISDASWTMFLNILDYKLKMLGRELVLVPPQYTSQKCSNCGAIVPKSLSVRTHICPECGYIADRDTNAAKNILRLGQSRQALTYGNSQSVA